MATIQAKIVNKDEVIKRLDKLKGEDAKKVMKSTVSDMKSRGPRWIAQLASQTYNITKAKLNPNTKSGGTRGFVQAAGDTLASISWTYRGQRLPIGGSGAGGNFKLYPRSHSGRPYILLAEVLRGQASTLGHWFAPWSEGGAYGAKSPYMLAGGAGYAVERRSPRSGGRGARRAAMRRARGPSVPQMVLSVRTKDELKTKLETEALKRLEHHIGRLLG